MNEIVIEKSHLQGEMRLPPSKSELLRLILLAACGKTPCRIPNGTPPLCEDVSAMLSVAEAMGAVWHADDTGLSITPGRGEQTCTCDVKECAAALRLSLPVFLMLGKEVHCRMKPVLWGRVRLGLGRFVCEISGSMDVCECKDEVELRIRGRLPRTFALDASDSSQLLSGVAIAFACYGTGEERCLVGGNVASKPYFDLTLSLLKRFGASLRFENSLLQSVGGAPSLPESTEASADLSAAAFPLCLNAWGHDVCFRCEDPSASLQGDAGLIRILQEAGAALAWKDGLLCGKCTGLRPLEVCCEERPDTAPLLALIAAAVPGESRLTGLSRLRLKECDRFHLTPELLRRFGVDIREAGESSWLIRGGTELRRGEAVDTHGDHRMVMTAVAASLCAGGSVLHPDAVCKSWPGFLAECQSLGMKASLESNEEETTPGENALIRSASPGRAFWPNAKGLA